MNQIVLKHIRLLKQEIMSYTYVLFKEVLPFQIRSVYAVQHIQSYDHQN